MEVKKVTIGICARLPPRCFLYFLQRSCAMTRAYAVRSMRTICASLDLRAGCSRLNTRDGSLTIGAGTGSGLRTMFSGLTPSSPRPCLRAAVFTPYAMKAFFQVGLNGRVPVPPEKRYLINKEDSYEHRTTGRTTRIRHFYLLSEGFILHYSFMHMRWDNLWNAWRYVSRRRSKINTRDVVLVAG